MKKFLWLTFLSLSCLLLIKCSGNSPNVSKNKPNPAKTPVIYIHDGAIDEYVAFLLLDSMENVDIQAVILVAGDSIAEPAMDAQWKIQSYINKPDIPIALSSARGWNPFPWDYRGQSIQQGNINSLKDLSSNPDWPPYPSGEELLGKLLTKAVKTKNPVTLLVNCPLTTLYTVLVKKPELEKGIAKMVWMAGAINVPGNIDPATLPTGFGNKKAEWNVFWDPVSTEWIFKHTTFPIIDFPLDVTDKAKIAEKFVSKLKEQSLKYKYSRLAFESYSLVYNFSDSNKTYYEMWDVLTTSYIARPGLFFPPKTLKLDIITQGINQGTMVQSETGRQVSVIFDIKHLDRYYTYVLTQFKR